MKTECTRKRRKKELTILMDEVRREIRVLGNDLSETHLISDSDLYISGLEESIWLLKEYQSELKELQS